MQLGCPYSGEAIFDPRKKLVLYLRKDIPFGIVSNEANKLAFYFRNRTWRLPFTNTSYFARSRLAFANSVAGWPVKSFPAPGIPFRRLLRRSVSCG